MYALSVYAETLSATEAAKATGIPKSTINNWLTEEDIDSTLEQLRLAIRYSCAHAYAMGAILAVNATIERLTNGDEVLNRDGELVRRKMSGRDTAAVASIFTDKHALLTQAVNQGANVDKTLTTLADKLMSMVSERMTKPSPDDLPDLT